MRQWHYGAIGQNGDQALFRVLQPIPPEDRERLVAATRLLLAVGPTSSYAALHDQFRLFEQVMDEAEANPVEGFTVYGGLTRFGTAMDNVLFAFRAFLDRTGHQLSQNYGANSAKVKTFKSAQTEEFDRFIEYRLCAKLRNMSQHVGHVISNVKARGERNQDGGMEVVAFEVTIDPAQLLSSYKDWGPVRKDLEEMDDVIQVRGLVSGLEQSCKVLFAHVLVSQRVEIEEAIRIVREAAAVCEPGPGEAPMTVEIDPAEWPPTTEAK